MRNVTVVAFTLILFAGLASAQIPTSGNIFVGYSFYSASPSTLDLSSVGRPNMNGWEASLEGKVLPWVGIVADLQRPLRPAKFHGTHAGWSMLRGPLRAMKRT